MCNRWDTVGINNFKSILFKSELLTFYSKWFRNELLNLTCKDFKLLDKRIERKGKGAWTV